MKYSEGHPIMLMNFYLLYEDGDEDACHVGVQMHSAGTEKKQVIEVLQKYIEADVEEIKELCQEKTEVCFFMKQKEECEKLCHELQVLGADAEFFTDAEDTKSY